MTKPLRRIAFAATLAAPLSFATAFPAAAEDRVYVENGETYSYQIVDDRELNTRCSLAYNDNGELKPEFIEILDTDFFHGGNPGTIATFLGPKFSRDNLIRNFPDAEKREKFIKYAAELDAAGSDVERAQALRKVIEVVHGEALDAAKYFDDLHQHCTP